MEVVVILVQNLRNARRVMALDKPKESLTKIDFQLLLLWKLVEIAEEWERSLKNHVEIVRRKEKSQPEKKYKLRYHRGLKME